MNSKTNTSPAAEFAAAWSAFYLNLFDDRAAACRAYGRAVELAMFHTFPMGQDTVDRMLWDLQNAEGRA